MNTSRRPVELFGLAFARISRRQAQLLDQRHQVGAVALERRAVAQVDPFEGELLDLLLDRRVAVRQEAAAQRPRVLAEAQVDARRLDRLREDPPSPATIHSRAIASRRLLGGQHTRGAAVGSGRRAEVPSLALAGHRAVYARGRGAR